MGIYDRDYMKRSGDRDSRPSDPHSAEDRLESLARHLLARKRLLQSVGIALVILILAGLLLTLF